MRSKEQRRCLRSKEQRVGASCAVRSDRESLARSIMADGAPEWTSFAPELTGPRFIEFQMRLTAYNADRFKPGLPEEAASQEPGLEHRVASAEVALSRHSARRLRDCRAYQRTPAALIELAPHRERLTTYRRPLRNSLRRWDHRNANWRQRRPFGSMPSSLSARTKRPIRLASFARPWRHTAIGTILFASRFCFERRNGSSDGAIPQEERTC